MRRNLSLTFILAVALAAGCGRTRELPAEVWQEAVTAFHVSLAAMQTSQDVLARQELERLIQLAPDEPAGHANLALLLMRQQQLEAAMPHLARAAALAPRHAGIARLQAVAEELRGNFDGAIEHWRRAAELDPSDPRAAYALARELERRADPASDAEALRVLRSLVERTGNLAARLEQARMAARVGDANTLRDALVALDASAPGWPEAARERLREVREAAFRSPADASTPLVFLRNVLLPTPEYRSAIAALTPAQGQLGDPLLRLVAIRNPDPHPAPADTALTFAVDDRPAVGLAAAAWAGAAWVTGDGNPVAIAASAREVRLGTGATLPFPGGTSGAPPRADAVLAADLDYDFRMDLVLAGAGGLRIHRQDANGAFEDVTRGARVPTALARGSLHGVWAADFDTDGDLDLVIAPDAGEVTVLRNNGDGTFASRNPFPGVARARGFAWADIDGEGVPDAVLLDADGQVRVFLNLRGAEFRDEPLPADTPRAAAVTAADADGDGRLDVLALTRDGAVVRMSPRSDARGWDRAEIARVDLESDLEPGVARLLTADLDNNGAFDLIVSSRAASHVVLRGPSTQPGARAGQEGIQLAGGAIPLRALEAADLDGDGRLELIGTGSAGGAGVARSRGEQAYHWQSIRPRAASVTGDQRVNSFGIGGEVEIRTGLHAQMRPIASPAVHFGLGGATTAEVARVIWPNGFVQSEFDLTADTTIQASQRLKGSCPWLFAWNGREMGFVTDFIWRSPLGLRINAQATADVVMTEDWVRIRGDQLAPRDGVYDIRITAELWETHFFDLVSLLVVDHPEGTEVFVDERFVVPPPHLEVIATSEVRAFAAVRDDEGRDVSAIVRERDDRHLDFAGRGAYQGVMRDHVIELELPEDAPRSGPLWLVGQGWVHPTDSSINVALGQGSHAPPRGLSLHAADANGRFRLVRSDLGFPAGKDKTILIDLTDVFPASGPRRLRLSTNLEIFWDRLGWAVAQPEAALVTKRLQPASAALRYRGFSVTAQKDASTPERPRYEIEGTAPRWFDLEGFHTRFGDVRELLLEVEDRYVIMNAGDELRLEFPEAPPPAPGMVRDFVLIGDGWEKDGDFNTTASRTVAPLPSHDDPRYDTRAGRLEDDPVYRRYPEDFERYHTRWVSPLIRRALRPIR